LQKTKPSRIPLFVVVKKGITMRTS